MILGIVSIFQRYKEQILSFEGTPEFIAKGFALGSFIGMLPIPGFHILSSLGLASVFKLNKKSVFLGVIKTNLFTAGFIFAFTYWLGKKILGIQPTFSIPEKINFEFALTVFNSGSEVLLSLWIGGLVMGVVSALVNYWIVFHFIKTYRNYAAG